LSLSFADLLYIISVVYEMDEEEEDAFVYVFDRRPDSCVERQKVHIGGVFSFEGFQEKISEVMICVLHSQLLKACRNVSQK